MSESATDEARQIQALQTASGFAERPVKQLLMSLFKKEEDVLFGDDTMPNASGVIKIAPPDGFEGETFHLRLEVVDSTYRIPLHRFGSVLEQGQAEIVRLFMAAEMYFEYAKYSYNLYPECQLWRSRHGSLYVAGTPRGMQHISVVFI